jgi:UDP-glucose 4-epimerase
MMSTFENCRILIVGGAGFVGSNLVKRLLKDNPRELLVVDNLLSAEKENLPDDKRITFMNASITDDAVIEKMDDTLDYVFHLATYHGNESSIANPLEDHENNTLTSLKLFNRIAGFKNLRKVVYASAGCTVAEKTFDKANATDEDAPVSLYLDSPYQISKIIGEFYGNYYFKLYGMPFVKARFQNVYGPGEVLGAGEWRGTPATVWRNVTPAFIYKAIKKMPLTLHYEGIATRDFIYVEDLVEGLVLCALNGVAGGIYNLASGVETSIRELAETINEITQNSTPVELLPKRDWDNSGKRYGSTEKASRELGFDAKVDLREGIEKTVKWTLEEMEFIQSCMDKHRQHMA